MKFGIFDHLDRGDLPVDELYRRRLDCVERYDRLGFYSYHLAEHHGTPLGMAPSPGMFLSSVAQRTKRLRLGPLVYLLPLYHPIRLAEEIAMLDQLSGGRLDVGVGRGRSPIELKNFGVDPKTTAPIFDESLEIIRAALAHGAVSHTGENFTFTGVTVETRPFQKPYPPFWYGIGTPESVDQCVERDFNIVTNARPELAIKIGERFRELTSKAKKEHLMLGLSRFVVVAETSDEARKLANRAYANWHKSFDHLFAKHGIRPVQAWPASFDAMADLGLAVCGSPAEVAEIMRDDLKNSGSNYYVAQLVFGDMTPDESKECIELFGTQVMPAIERELSAA